MGHLWPRQPGRPERVIRHVEHPRRAQRLRYRHDPAPDRRRRLVADLLRRDRLQQAGKAARSDAPGQRAGGRLDHGQARVGGDQRRDSVPHRGRRMREAGRRRYRVCPLPSLTAHERVGEVGATGEADLVLAAPLRPPACPSMRSRTRSGRLRRRRTCAGPRPSPRSGTRRLAASRVRSRFRAPPGSARSGWPAAPSRG